MNTNLKLQDTIEEHLTKTHAILNCLLAAWDSRHHLDQDTIFNALWSMDDHLQEIKKYRTTLIEVEKTH